MNIKFIICLYITLYASIASSVEITETNKLIQASTEFYTQSSGGSLSTCGIEFSGVDSKQNYFSGSFALLNIDKRNLAPIFKIKSSILNLDGSTKTRRLEKAWLKSPDSSTLSKNWASKSVDEHIIVVERKVDEGVNIYIDIVRGKNIKVGYLHQGATLDVVFQLKPFPNKDEEAARSCLIQLVDDLE